MTKNASDSIRINVIGGVLTAFILGIGGAIWAFTPNAWAWIIHVISKSIDHLATPTSTPTWWLYVLYLALLAWIVVAALVIYASIANKEPRFTDYRKDFFFGAIWRWQYTSSGLPTDTWAFCPICDTVLVYSHKRDYGEFFTSLTCETCNHQVLTNRGDKDDLVAKVERQIDRKIRNDEWKKQVTSKAK